MAFGRLARFAIAFFGFVSLASAQVDIVGKPHLGPFPTIQGAVDAATDGDILWVNAGVYNAGFWVQNKALTVIGAPGGVILRTMVLVADLGPARRVSLINLTVDVPPSTLSYDQPGLRLRDNLGVVRAQNCFFKGSFQYGSGVSPYAGCGAEVTQSAKVVFTRCTLVGRGMGFELSGEWSRAGGDGLRATDSGVALYDCQLTGGHGSEETYPAGGDGGAGCRITRVGVFSAGSTFRAGNGGGGDFVGCTSQGDGGHGLVLTDAQGQLYSTTLIPGFATGYWSCHPGHDGRRFVKSGESVLNEFTGPVFKLSGPTYVSDNSAIPLVIQGAPGSSVYLLVGDGSGFHYVSAWSNLVANPQPWTPHPLGIVGANSTLNAQWSVPDIVSPRPAWVWTLQAMIVSPAGDVTLSSPLQMYCTNS